MRFFPDIPRPNDRELKSAWRDFISTGSIAPGCVRPHVLRAWERSRSCGCDPRLARADLLSEAATDALLKRERPLIELASPFLNALSTAAGGERHAAMLSDGQGRVLKILGDPETMSDADFPRPGSLLSEATAGANGIGTTLAEGHYVELIGPEHFIEGFHVFTCQGAPLLDLHGAPRAALSMSLRKIEAANRVRDILFCASQAATCELLSSELSAAISSASGIEALLESLRQDLVQSITIARLRLELAADDLSIGLDASLSLTEVYDLVLSFQRHAKLWRDLALPVVGTAEPILLGALASEFMTLMATEARVTGTTLVLGEIEKVWVQADRRAFSRRVLESFLSSMQRASPGDTLRIDVFAENLRGVLALTNEAPTGEVKRFQTNAPLVPPPR